MVCTAFNQDALGLAAWTPLHSITLHGIHCIHSGCFWPCCIKSTAFKYSAGIHCLQSCCINSPTFNRVPFLHAAWNTLHSIRLHGIHCIQSGCILPGCLESMHSSHCMDSTAYNRDPLRHNAWNPLHSMTLHGIHCIPSGCFGPCCIKSTAFNHAAWNPLHSIGMFWAMLH